MGAASQSYLVQLQKTTFPSEKGHVALHSCIWLLQEAASAAEVTSWRDSYMALKSHPTLLGGAGGPLGQHKAVGGWGHLPGGAPLKGLALGANSPLPKDRPCPQTWLNVKALHALHCA